MLSIASKARSVLWYLPRPRLWPQLGRSIADRLVYGPEADTSGAAASWCEERGVTTEDALAKILGKAERISLESAHKEDCARARELEKGCPVVMGGPGDLDLLYSLVRETGATRVVETGVAYGWSSLAILLAMQGRSNALLVSTDMPYVQGHNERFVGCVMHRQDLMRHWKLLRLPDRDALPAALRDLGAVDLCHYDSDKSHRGRSWAYPLLWKHLRSGGIFLSDDIQDNLAFRDFSANLGLDPLVVKVSNERHTKYVGLLVKP